MSSPNEHIEFTEDWASADMLLGRVIRSPIENGSILEKRSDDLPEGCLAAAAGDIPGRNRMKLYDGEMPFLATDRVCYLGEPVMLVAGPTEEHLQEAAARISLQWREEPFVREEPPYETGYTKGNCSRAFKEADHIVEGRYTCGSHAPCSYRSHTVVCTGDAASGWTLYTPSLHPFELRDNVAALLGVSKTKVTVRVPGTSHGTAGYVSSVLAAGHAALMCCLSGRPVRLALALGESRRYGPRRFPARVHYRTAVDAEGTILGMEADLVLETGGHGVMARQALTRAALAACGAYSCDNLHVTARLETGPRPPYGGGFGFGEPQGAFALERHASKIAETAQLDPFTWKKQNLFRSGPALPLGGRLATSEASLAVLEDVVNRSGFVRKHAAFEAAKKRRRSIRDPATPLRGIGLAAAYHGVGSFPGRAKEEPCAFKVLLDTNKKLHCRCSFTTSEPAWLYPAVAAEILGIPESDVEIEPVDTAQVPNSGPSVGSRPGYIGTRLLARCCETVRKKRIRSLPPIEALSRYRPKERTLWDPDGLKGDPYVEACWEAAVVQIEVDPVTMVPEWKGIWISLDSGYADAREKSELESSLLSEAAYAALKEPSGREPVSPADEPWSRLCFGFRASEIPPPQIHMLAAEDKPSRKKGLGDHPVLCLAPAYANAVSQALGHAFDGVPVTPENIEEALG